jgi:putative ABC transport system permease protein
VPVSSWSAAVSDQQAKQNQVGLELLLGIAIAHSLIGIANTFLMSTGGRRSELTLLHKTGAIRRQIVWIIAAESLVLTLIGIVLSAVVSSLVLGGLYVAVTGETGSVSIILPWPLVGAILAGCVVLAVLTSTLPAWFQFRPRRRPYSQDGGPGSEPGRRARAAGRSGAPGGAPVQQPDGGAEGGGGESHEDAGLDELEGPEPAGRLVGDEVS